jgi:hypothetical protein
MDLDDELDDYDGEYEEEPFGMCPNPSFHPRISTYHFRPGHVLILNRIK